jgi:uncharacterized UBP type Zn finger protein
MLKLCDPPTDEDYIDSSSFTPVGLFNYGATCYIAALMQMLLSIDQFRSWLFNIKHTQYTKNFETVHENLYNFFFETDKPEERYKKVVYDVIAVLGTTKKVENDPYQAFTSLMQFFENRCYCFSFFHTEQTKCSTVQCNYKKLDLSTGTSDMYERKLITSTQDIFVEGKRLRFPSESKCPVCSKRTLYSVDVIVHFPKVFIIRLNHRTTPGIITETMQIETIFHEKLEYVLRGVIVHGGETAKGGHYYATVKYKHQWYLCNDKLIRKKKFSYLKRVHFGESKKISAVRRAMICVYFRVDYPGEYDYFGKVEHDDFGDDFTVHSHEEEPVEFDYSSDFDFLESSEEEEGEEEGEWDGFSSEEDDL